MNITLYGRIPSKKNSVVMFVRGGKLFKMPSNPYRKWHKDASRQLLGVNKVRGGQVELMFYAPDKRKTDLTNKAESVMDLLCDNGIISDDNWHVIPTLILKFGGVDSKNPRVEITIL